MDDLIRAFQIFRKYGNSPHPTICEHDVLIVDIMPEDVTDGDKEELESLGFFVGDGAFESYRFGSA